MPVVPTKEILQDAFNRRYGVAAFNIVNDLTLEAVVAAAVELRAPLIVQTSVKTVKAQGLDELYALFRVAGRARTSRLPCISITARTAPCFRPA